MRPARLMGSSHGRGRFGGRVQRCKRRRLLLSELIQCSNAVRRRRVGLGLEIREGGTDRDLALNRFQEGWGEVGDTDHLVSATIE